MKKGAVTLFFVIIMLFSMALFTTTGFADAGNFTSDFDWGGSDDWGGSSDWGSSSWDSDYVSGYDSYGSDIFLLGGFDFGWVGILAVIAIIVILSFKRAKKRGTPNPANGAARASTASPGVTSVSLSVLKDKDPAFSEAELLDKVGNLYVQMQNAWEKKEWEPMRAHMTDNLFNQMARQLDELVMRGYTNYMQRICVMNSAIRRYSQDEQNDILTVELTARLVDYTVDSHGKLINGSKTAEKYITYEWTLVRDKNALTIDKDGMQTVACPNCGAPVNVARSAKCEYCDTVITLDSQEWVISAIRGISQRTV